MSEGKIWIDLDESAYFKNLGSTDAADGFKCTQGIFDLNDEIYESSLARYATFEAMLTYHQSIAHDVDEITIRLLDNSGGRASVAFALYDMIRGTAETLRLPVLTMATGVCASAAAQIVLQAGDRRVATRRSLIMVHELAKATFMTVDKASDLKDQQIGIDYMVKVMYEIMAKKSGKTVEEIHEFVDRHERWLSADEALEFGLIDGVLECA